MNRVLVRDVWEVTVQSSLFSKLLRRFRRRSPSVAPESNRAEILSRNHKLFMNLNDREKRQSAALFERRLKYVHFESVEEDASAQ